MLLLPLLVAIETLLDFLSVALGGFQTDPIFGGLQLLTLVVVFLGYVLLKFREGLVEEVLLLDLVDLFKLHEFPFFLVGEIFQLHVLIFQFLLKSEIVLVILVSVELFGALSFFLNFRIICILKGNYIPCT